MNKPLIFLCLIFLQTALQVHANGQVQWKSFDTAIQLAQKDSQFVFVDLYADWCLPCRIMEKTTFKDSTVIQLLNEHFHPVKLNAESEDIIQCNHWPRPIRSCVVENWKLQGIPSVVLVGPSGNYLLSVTQGLNPEQMQLLLRDFLKDRALLLESDKNHGQ